MCGYAACIAAQLGANIVKVKLPSAYLEQKTAKKIYDCLEEAPLLRKTACGRIIAVLTAASV